MSWRSHNAVVWEKSPWSDTLEVYVHTPARFFVNGEEVARSDLHSKLIEQLGRRAEWTVYFEADSDVAYMNAVYAIDTIQACGAKLIWITPKMRKDWQEETKNRPDRKAKRILRSESGKRGSRRSEVLLQMDGFPTYQMTQIALLGNCAAAVNSK